MQFLQAGSFFAFFPCVFSAPATTTKIVVSENVPHFFSFHGYFFTKWNSVIPYFFAQITKLKRRINVFVSFICLPPPLPRFWLFPLLRSLNCPSILGGPPIKWIGVLVFKFCVPNFPNTRGY